MSETRTGSRRQFLAQCSALTAGVSMFGVGGRAAAQPADDFRRPRANGPVAVSSGNGRRAVARAIEMLRGGADPLDAVVDGVRIVEDDPEDMTVGLGGLPNEEGVVQLDSSVMHGPSCRAGAVGALERIQNPAAVAREVARRTDHVMLVGEGALKFAKRMGFQETNLLTEKAREAWLRWRNSLNREDDWLNPDQYDLPSEPKDGSDLRSALDIPFTYGTIHCSALDANSDLAGVTTTSGLSWKLPGRVGDSPIIGAGLYTDNAVGSAGATGRGEAVIQTCGAHTVVSRMDVGDHPVDACVHALKKIADKTKSPRLLDSKGRPNFNVIFYAVRKDGAYGSAAMYEGREFAVADGNGDRIEPCAWLYDAR